MSVRKVRGLSKEKGQHFVSFVISLKKFTIMPPLKNKMLIGKKKRLGKGKVLVYFLFPLPLRGKAYLQQTRNRSIKLSILPCTKK